MGQALTLDRDMDAYLEDARSGHNEAYFELGLRYAIGKGVDIDLVQAHKWFNLAAMAGDVRAQEERRDLALEMTPQEIATAQKLAREWLGTLQLPLQVKH